MSLKSRSHVATPNLLALFLLVGWCCQILLPLCEANKRLVLFAGPHKAAATSVEHFFYEYAKGHSRLNDDGTKKPSGERATTFGLRYWRWPRIEGPHATRVEGFKEEPYKIFSQLVEDVDNDELREEIYKGMQETWDTDGFEGLIVGTEDFDQIGRDAEYDALYAMKGIVNQLKVSARDVTVVLNYRTPRVEQWGSMWTHTYMHDETATSYEEWLCDGTYLHKHIGILGTAMDPMNAAAAFLEEGWKVRLVDMGGVEEAGRDISHVIACDVITGRCDDDGSVLHHAEDNPHKNAAELGLTALSEKELADAEALFRARECAYKEELGSNDNFEVVLNQTVWTDCNPKRSKTYKKLRQEPSYMYRALLSQVKCPNGSPIQKRHMVTMKQVLKGKIPQRANQYLTHAAIDAEASGKRPPRSVAGRLMEILIVVFIAVGAVGYQLHKIKQLGPLLGANRRMTRHEEAVAEAEMSAISSRTSEKGGYRDTDDADADEVDPDDAEYGDVI